MALDDRQIEHAVLSEIIALHPGHLTTEELVVRMEDDATDIGRTAIIDALQALKRSGLVRIHGEVVEPTYAARCAAALFELS